MKEETSIQTEMFHEIPVRIVQGEKGPMIPLVDIANGLGYLPQVITRLYERNRELLEKHSQTAIMTTGDQIAPVKMTCLSRDGIVGLTMKLDYRKTKSPEKKAAILAFQDWAIITLGKVMDHKIPTGSTDYDNVIETLKGNLRISATLSECLHVDPMQMTRVALDNTIALTGTDPSVLNKWGDFVASEYHLPEPALITAGDIAAHFRMKSAQVANNTLKRLDLQFKIGKKWIPTDAGKEFSWFKLERIDHPTGPRYHYHLYWKPSVLEFIRQKCYSDASQSTLASGSS